MSNIFANKYRPTKLADVIGQEVPVTILTNSFKNKKLHHFYIFHGHFGSSKTTVARIIAAMENCEKGPTLDPCTKCKNCVEIFSGKSNDIKEIDAASTRGIDDIREMRSNAYFSPLEAQIKYYLLEEAHSLTPQAVEALLKITEEPPEKVRFILTTTDISAMPETLLSRSCDLYFGKVSWFEIVKRLEYICQCENILFDEYGLQLIAKNSDGSVRVALKNLEKVSSFGVVSKDNVLKVLQKVDDALIYKLFEHIVAKQPKDCISVISDIVVQSKPNLVISQLVDHVRNVMLSAINPESLTSLGFSSDDIKRYQFQGKNIKYEILPRILVLISEVKQKVDLGIDFQLLLEQMSFSSIILLKRADKNLQ